MIKDKNLPPNEEVHGAKSQTGVFGAWGLALGYGVANCLPGIEGLKNCRLGFLWRCDYIAIIG